MRVVLADPPAFTPPYDHELAAALARGGAEVELMTSHFRFGGIPPAASYERVNCFYPLSSHIPGRSRLRLPFRAIEHLFVIGILDRRWRDVLHLQWLAWPRMDRLLRFKGPTVFTAHDLLPRRTAAKRDLWRSLLQKFDRVVVHSEYGHAVLADLGVDARVIPHPVFPSEPRRADNGETVLALGLIRSYKGIDDAVEATRRIDARLLVVGDRAEPIRLDAPHVEARLGYVSDDDVDRALGQATVAVFPYRPEVDQSGAMMRVLGGGVPVVAYDVGGLAEPIRRFDAGGVVEAGNVEALAATLRELLQDPQALERARAGARRAREELTWDAAAAAHLELYREIV